MRYIIAIGLFSSALYGQVQVFSDGFESGTLGQTPPGWSPFGNNPGYQTVLTNQGCAQGRQCVKVTISPAGSYVEFATARPSPGVGTVRFRAALRVSDGATAYLYLGANTTGCITYGETVVSPDWVYDSVQCTTTALSSGIYFGVHVESGTAWFDDVTVEFTGSPVTVRTEPPEGPRPLSDTGLANLVAFAKLAGYVRYFHPSDQSAELDWETFVIKGLRAVEDAPTPDELAKRLRTLFDPIAPTVRVFLDGAAPDLPAELSPSSPNGLSVVQWSHYGVRVSQQGGTYQSTRRRGTLSGGRLPAGFTDPAQPYRASLGNGLTVWVPVALYADQQGTLPLRPSVASSDLWNRDVRDRGTRLGDVMLAWNIFQHFYPYFEVTEVDMPGELRRALLRAAENTGLEDFLATMQRLVAALKDGHGSVSYIGRVTSRVPLVWAWAEGQVIVARVRYEQGQGVQPGDRVLTIDGTDVSDVMARQAQLEAGATPQWIRWRTLQDIAGCDPQTGTMRLGIEPFAAPGTRRDVQFTCRSDFDWSETRPNAVADLEPGILYVDLDRITLADLTAALPRLQSATAIVFDFRGYPRIWPPQFLQYLTTTTLQSELFLVPTPAWPDQAQMTFQQSGGWNLAPLAPYLTAKRVFLTDARAISQAETDMDLVEYYKLADFVGEPTAGTTGNVNPFSLPGGFTVSWTGMKVLKPGGARFHGVGIRPNIPVSRTRRGIAAGQDEILQRGVEIVKGPQAGPAPQITAAGMVNGASFAGGAVAPGEIVAIFGTGLGPDQVVLGTYDESGFLTKYAGGTRVFFDGIQAPLTAVSAGQVNAIVPYGVTASTVVKVEYQLRSSNEVAVPVMPAAPGIFCYSGRTQGVIVNQNGGFNSASAAAARGEIITFFATGEGQTAPGGRDGVLPAAGKWPVPAGDVAVLFGGVPGDIQFKGEVYAGVLQVNVRVPQNAPSGDAVPLVLSAGGIASGGHSTIALK